MEKYKIKSLKFVITVLEEQLNYFYQTGIFYLLKLLNDIHIFFITVCGRHFYYNGLNKHL